MVRETRSTWVESTMTLSIKVQIPYDINTVWLEKHEFVHAKLGTQHP